MSCRKRKVMMRTSRPLPPWPITGFLLRSTCSIMVGATLKQATTGCSYGTHTRKTPRASWMSMCSVSWKHPAVNLRAQVATLRSPAPLTGSRWQDPWDDDADVWCPRQAPSSAGSQGWSSAPAPSQTHSPNTLCRGGETQRTGGCGSHEDAWGIRLEHGATPLWIQVTQLCRWNECRPQCHWPNGLQVCASVSFVRYVHYRSKVVVHKNH